MDWFLYDNGLRHERVSKIEGLKFQASIIFCLTITDDRCFLRLGGKILGGYRDDSEVS